ncbi:YebG family protein [Teredinibacter franksiae]|jgi:Uncharacterized protein conserved in bacteria|uniref:YebG family protein n=1 Tax=Teredinibacter franksiae TaxID=2761453 RepID=UPI001623AD0C|nr:YebG family protein [Teredinibacter franksiae]
MAVIAVWKCDRDGSMFEDKKSAEAHDKMLELAANITSLIESEIPDVSEQACEAIGLLLAKRSEDLVRACKGKPSVLLEASENSTEEKATGEAIVTSIAG